MTPIIFYFACLAGAFGLFLVMRPHQQGTRAFGALVGAGAVGGIMLMILKALPDDSAIPYLEIFFGLGSVAGAARLITHPRPVFAAIYFVVVVVCSAGLFLIMQAEFMAFALIIVYAGAILITYLFVLMLAQEASASPGEQEYDLIPRDPIAALVVGFVLLASIGDALLSNEGGVKPPDNPQLIEERYTERWEILQGMPKQLERVAEDIGKSTGMSVSPSSMVIEGGRAYLTLTDESENSTTPDVRHQIEYEYLPTNTQEVGWELVAGFPVSLEMAGVILLMAMFGAVVLARRQIELGEDERRQAGGLEPVVPDEDAEVPGGTA